MTMASLLELLGIILSGVGTIAYILIIYAAFQESVLVGLLCIIPLFGLWFILNNWSEVKTPAFISITCTFLGGLLQGISTTF